ncbi:MAG: hypothetical protein LBL60_01410 [Mycoplasmataceae bacterium]|jgi:hypothetical protein|nr:hypothetical protein [Mycoplasmataceae bacterium]
MKLPIAKEDKTVCSYRIYNSTVTNIEKLAKENKCSRGEIIDYAIKELMKGSKN